MTLTFPPSSSVYMKAKLPPAADPEAPVTFDPPSTGGARRCESMADLVSDLNASKH